MWRRWWSCGGAALNRKVFAAAFAEHAPQNRVFGLNHLCSSSPSPGPSPPSTALSWFLLSRAVSTSAYKLAPDSSSSPTSSSDFGTGNVGGAGAVGGGGIGEEMISTAEAKKLMRLVNVKSLKEKLGMEGKEVIQYTELLKACQRTGVARSQDEAIAFSRVLDDAGVVLLFRDKVYLHPDKVVDQVKKIVLPPEEDPTIDELIMLQEKKEEIDVLAHKQVRRILWVGLGLSVLQVSLFFRLTFWEFSWDVMEPIAFFTTATGIVIGYAYFMFTSRDPTYQDLMKRLFLSRQRKLIKKMNFDVNRLKELQIRCRSPCDAATSIKKRVGVEVELEDALHKN